MKQCEGQSVGIFLFFKLTLISGWSLKRDDTDSTLLSHVASRNWDSTVLSIHRTKKSKQGEKRRKLNTNFKKEQRFSFFLHFTSFPFVPVVRSGPLSWGGVSAVIAGIVGLELVPGHF